MQHHARVWCVIESQGGVVSRKGVLLRDTYIPPSVASKKNNRIHRSKFYTPHGAHTRNSHRKFLHGVHSISDIPFFCSSR